MLSSMTGFGRGEQTRNGTTVTVEIRSVNNRYCEVSAKLPPSLQPMEQELRDLIQKRVDRGKLSVAVRLDQPQRAAPVPRFDAEAARHVHQDLDALRTALGIAEPVGLSHLLRFDSLYQIPEADSGDEPVKPLLMQATVDAIASLQEMRRQEGITLQKDLETRLSRIETTIDAIESASKERIPEARRKMAERIRALMDGDSAVDAERLELEVAILADKLDITEELVRMQSHIVYFRGAMNADEPAGRKINFLIQEMHREVNTMGAKANHAGVAHMVVELKEILEIIREQIQNIE